MQYQNEPLKFVLGKSATRLLGVHYNMWSDAEAQLSHQRTKVIDGAIEVAAYLYKNEDLRIDQALQVVSMCLPPLLAFLGPLVRWAAADFKTLSVIWLRAYKNAWNLGRSTATGLFRFLRDQGELPVKLPMGTMFDWIWRNLERCSQFDNGNRQMMEFA